MIHFDNLCTSKGAKCGSKIYFDGYEASSGTQNRTKLASMASTFKLDFESGHGLYTR